MKTASKPGSPKARLPRILFALATGLLFLFPHLVRIHRVGSYAAYTPFTALSPSPMVWDETFLYGAQTNYTLTHHTLANDTDTWEHRDQPYPYSVLPIELEALLAQSLGSLKTAHLLCAFLFPALSTLLLIALFARLGATNALAALLALAVLVLGFSPTTLIRNDLALLHHLHGPAFLESLQAARTPNPNLTFPLFLAALLCLTNALRRPSASKNPAIPVPKTSIPLWPLDAGILGGLLFLSYIYYALTWSAAVAILALISLHRRSGIARTPWITLAVTILVALPFLWWKHLSAAAGAFLPRSLRTGLESGHALHRGPLITTAAYLLLAALALAAWRWLDTRPETARTPERLFAAALIPVLLASILGALAGLNMQLLIGFNVQADHHFPHMVLQPLLLILAASLFVLAAPRLPRILPAAAFTLFFAACAAAQLAAGLASAEDHRLPENDRLLFTFLNQQTPAGSVVATDNLRLSIELPTLTHNRILFANGTRTTAPDAELLDRFLLASRLAGATPDQVRTELTAVYPAPRPAPQVPTYTYYLFEASPYELAGARRIAPAQLPALLEQYRTLDLPAALRRFRIDFLWTESATPPPTIPGWTFNPVLTTPAGRLLSLAPTAP